MTEVGDLATTVTLPGGFSLGPAARRCDMEASEGWGYGPLGRAVESMRPEAG